MDGLIRTKHGIIHAGKQKAQLYDRQPDAALMAGPCNAADESFRTKSKPRETHLRDLRQARAALHETNEPVPLRGRQGQVVPAEEPHRDPVLGNEKTQNNATTERVRVMGLERGEMLLSIR